MPDRVRHVIGCMTGTSLDGLDAALVRITGEGLAMRAEFVSIVSHPLDELAATLRSFANGDRHVPLDYLRAARKLGELHAAACVELLRHHACVEAKATPAFVVAHGQTIWHAPRDEHGHLSWQLLDPWPIVRRLRVPVCYDLRQADLIAGGEGAPITPIADWVMYRDRRRGRVIVNLGGICNITDIPPGSDEPHVYGGDIGPCNLLIDGVVQALYPGHRFDAGGQIAQRGAANAVVWDLLQESSYFRRREPQSTGREDFGPSFILEIIERTRGSLSPEDVVASAVDAVARVIGSAVAAIESNEDVVLAGGGAKNPALVDAVTREARGAQRAGGRVVLSDALGIPIEAREAIAFAVLGALSQDGVPITLPQVTGSTTPGRAGAWVYP